MCQPCGTGPDPTILRRAARLGSRLLLVFCTAFTASFAGCLVAPVPMATHVAGVSGSQDKKNLDLKFVEPGKTSHSEVLQKLSWADSGIKDPHLFLGRWFSSGSGWIWAVGSNGGGEGGTHRNWTSHNYLVEFDEADVVRTAREFPTPNLIPALQDWLTRANLAALDFTPAVELTVDLQRTKDATLSLSATSFEVRNGGKKPRTVQIRRSNISTIIAGTDPKVRDEHASNLIGANILFHDATPFGEQLFVYVSAPDLLTLLRYANHEQSSSKSAMR